MVSSQKPSSTTWKMKTRNMKILPGTLLLEKVLEWPSRRLKTSTLVWSSWRMTTFKPILR